MTQKKFITESISFLMIFVLILISINALYYKKVSFYASSERTERQFYENKNKIEILFMGDSRVKNGINPENIKNSFNFAQGDESYIGTYYKLKKIIKNPDFNPELIVMQIDLISFSEERYKSFISTQLKMGAWHWSKYVNSIELSLVASDISLMFQEINRAFPFLGEGILLIERIKSEPKNITPLYKGYPTNRKQKKWTKKLEANKQEEIKKLNRQVKRRYSDPSKYFHKVEYAYFIKILELTRKSDIKVALIRFPITKEQYDALEKHVDGKDEFFSKIESIANRYENVVILEYERIFPKKSDNFYDAIHLNGFGADIFSNILKKDIDKILQ